MKKDTCANRLKRALDIRNIKQIELSNKTGIPKSAISQYISGAFEPKQDRVELISKVLNVNEAWLMGYDVPMDKSASPQSELNEYLEELRTRPEMKMLFSLTKDATKEEVEKAVKIIETLLGKDK